MKKILLLLVSGLLISCITGSALAVGVLFPYLPIENNIKVAYINPNSPTFTTEMDVQTDKTGVYLFNLSTSSSKLSASIIGLNSQNLGPASLTPVCGDINLPVARPATDPYIATLKIEGAENGKIYLHMKNPNSLDPDDQNTVYVSVTTKIPEFPIIALPVAGVIGLIFIFGRNKGDM